MLSVLDDSKSNPDIHVRQNDQHRRLGLTQEVIGVKAAKVQLPPAAQME
jgi:hypothetical protein